VNRAGEPEDGLDLRRRRLHFRAWHRGLREVDLLLGRFADAHVGAFSEEELAAFEELLMLPDPDLLGWIVDPTAMPPSRYRPMLTRIAAFHLTSGLTEES
jgi:antitoxin CptB